MSERTARSGRDPEVTESILGPGLPTLRIGSGSKTLVYLPGLSLHPGLPTGMERRMATSGWEPLLNEYSVYRIGRRLRPVGTTFSEMADDAIAAVEELGPPVDLMGGSTGGMLALHVAAARPELVRRLVLVITGPTLSDDGRRQGQRIVDAVRTGRWRTVFATILPIGSSGRFRRSVYGALGWLLGPRLVGIPADPTLILGELDAWTRVDATGLLPGIGHPTLVVGGANDRLFPPAAVESMAHALPNATLVIMPGVAHDFPSRLMGDHIAPFLLTGDVSQFRS